MRTTYVYEVIPPEITAPEVTVAVVLLAALAVLAVRVIVDGVIGLARDLHARPKAPQPQRARPGRLGSAFARYQAGEITLQEFRARDDDPITEPIPVIPAKHMASAA